MTQKERIELTRRVAALPIFEQLQIIEQLVRQLRQAHTDHEAEERAMDAMLNDPGMQRVLRNEDLEEPNVAG